MKRFLARWLLWRSDVAERKASLFSFKALTLFERAKTLLGEARK